MLNENETVTTDETVDAEAQEVEESIEDETTEEAEAQESEETSTEESTEDIDKPIDYKAIIEKEKTASEEAFKKREERREKQREAALAANGGSQEESTDEDMDKPLTRRELDAYFAERDQQQTKAAQDNAVKAIIDANTSSTEEAEAAFLMYQNRVVPTGDPQQDAMFAIGGLNAKRMKQITEEVKRANKSKENTNISVSSPQQTEAGRPETKISSADANAIKAAGLAWDAKKGLYKKPIAGGKKFMYYDPKRPAGEKKWVA